METQNPRAQQAFHAVLVQRDEAVKHYLGSLLGSTTLSDCRFRIVDRMGHKPDVVIPAHRIVLAQYKFFMNMFGPDFVEERDIIVDSVDEETMRVVLKFLYTGEFCVNFDNAFAVYIAASQFCISHLTDALRVFFSECSMEDKLQLLVHAGKIEGSQGPLTSLCMESIAACPRVALASPEFYHLPAECLRMLLEGDLLGRAREDDIYDAVVGWATAQEPSMGAPQVYNILSELFGLIRWGWVSQAKIMQAKQWLSVVPGFAPIHHQALLASLERQTNGRVSTQSAASGALYLRPRKRPCLQMRVPDLTARLSFNTAVRITCVAVHADNVYTGHVDHLIRCWDAKTGQLKALLGGHQELVVSMDIRNGVLVSGARDSRVLVWDITHGPSRAPMFPNAPPDFTGHCIRPLHVLEGHEQSVYGTIIMSGAIFSCSRDRTVRKWVYNHESESGKLAPPQRPVHGHSIDLASSALSIAADDQLLYVACGDGRIRVFQANTMAHVGELHPPHDSTMRCVHYCGPMALTLPLDESAPYVGYGVNPDARRFQRVLKRVIAAGSTDGVVFLYDADTRQLLWKTKRHTSKVFAVSHSGTRNCIVSSSEDGTACVWNPDLLEVRGPCGLQERSDLDIVEDGSVQGFGPQGSGECFPATVRPNPSVQIVNVPPPARLQEVMVDGLVEVIRQHQDWVTGVAAVDDTIVTCSRDEHVGIFSIE